MPTKNTTYTYRFGIRAKLLLPIFLGFIILFAVLILIWQPSQLKKGKADFIVSQTKILKSLSPSLIQSILSSDLSSLHSNIENSLRIHKNEWKYIQLINVDKQQLYPIFDKKPDKTKTLLEIKLQIEENAEVFGDVYLYTDWQQAREKEIENINLISVWSIIIFSIIAIMSYILQTLWIYNPITKLEKITSKFSLGEYDATLPKVTLDEIGLLTDSIDRMRHKIKASLIDLVDKEKMQRAIVESVPDAIITIDTKGIVQSFNPGAENIFQYPASEVIGKNIKMLMADDIAEHHDQYIKNFSYSSSQKVIRPNRELLAQKKDLSEFPIELSVNAKIIDDEYLFTGIIRDITERKRVDRVKSEFISTVSHELRTPLTAIKGSLDIITNGLNLELPHQAESMLTVANRNVERLLNLINDILDFSKLDSEGMDFVEEQFEITPFLNNSIEINQEYANKLGSQFIFTHGHEDIWVSADKNRLEQVMSNLLSNAAKYSPKDKPVEIYTEVSNNIIRINIKDYGPGIASEFQNKLFEKFTQSSSGNTRQVGGTGLGLNISKMIIEKMGGTIGFTTEEGKGSTFYFELHSV